MNLDTFDAFDNSTYDKFCKRSRIEKDINTLIGILEGIDGDNIINEKEIDRLEKWMDELSEVKSFNPYSSIFKSIQQALEDRVLSQEEVEDIKWLCNQYRIGNPYFDKLTVKIQELHGIIKGINFDNEINEQEIYYLKNWIQENSILKNSWPYDEIDNLILSILEDRIITPEEGNTLKAFLQSISQIDDVKSSGHELIKILNQGFCQVDPHIEIQEKNFCITGISNKYQRKEIAQMIELYGGYINNGVSSKLNYLIVCSEKNSCWAFNCYGRKVEKAVEHRMKGNMIQIIHEFDFYDKIEDLK